MIIKQKKNRWKSNTGERKEEDTHTRDRGTEEQGRGKCFHMKEREKRRGKLMLIGQRKLESIILSLTPRALE
jgi:hypothetical protein